MKSLQDNTFAAACYEMNSIDELQQALAREADAVDMREWGLTEEEYFAQIQLALAYKSQIN